MSNKMKILLVLLLGLATAMGVAYYLYNKPLENMAKASTDYKLESKALFAEFESNEASANEKYLGKVVEVSGTIQEVNMDDGNKKIILEGDGMMFGVICNLDELTNSHRTDFKAGENVTLKCKCTGILMDVVLDRCIEIKH